VKLDPSFIHDVTASSDNAIVVSAVIGMGKSLKHRMIAEGVETPEQLAFLQAYGCDEGLGHYFSRPLAAHQFAKLMERSIRSRWRLMARFLFTRTWRAALSVGLSSVT
jgi:diguanylate cyclase